MPDTIELALHSYSCRLRYLHDPDYDVFSFIDQAHSLGFSGVNISLSGPDNDRLPPNRHLCGNTDQHLARVSDHLRRRRLSVELDTDTVEPTRLTRAIEIARTLGARVLRTFTHHPYGPRIVDDTVRDLRAIAPAVERAGVIVAVENHEEFTSAELTEIAAAVDDQSVRLLFDYGNSIPVLETPEEALHTMRPWVAAAHMKDTAMVAAKDAPDGVPATIGVPLGHGTIDLVSLTHTLVHSGLRRICLQNAWGYHVPLGKLRPVSDLHGRLGRGVFRYTHPPFAPDVIAFHPEQHLTAIELIAAEHAALITSARCARHIIDVVTNNLSRF